MVKILLLLCILFVSIVGLCEIIYLIRKFATYPGVRTECYCVFYLEKGCAFKQLKFLNQKIRWQGSEFANGIIAVTDNLEIQEIDDCTDFALKNNIILCNIDSLNECFLLYKENF